MGLLHLVTGRAGYEHITPADHGAFHNALLMSGNYVLNSGNKFSASVISNNSIKISDGELIMQGRHIRLKPGDVEEITIENGTQDYKRNDLIVVRYVKDGTTGLEGASLVVIQGTPDISTASDPAYIEGNILNGVLTADFPLYRVPLDGLNVGEIVQLFEVVDNFDERIKAMQTKVNNIQTTSKATLSTAGWYRVAEITNSMYGSAFVKISVPVNSNGGAEEHILFFNYTLNNRLFEPFSCKSSGLRAFTKIRYTSDGTKRYIEVYYAPNGRNECVFSVFGQTTAETLFKAITPTLTSETVSGVTVVTTYDIPSNATPATSVDLASYFKNTGGEIESNKITPLVLHNASENDTQILQGFKLNKAILGYLGFNGVDNPIVYSTTLGTKKLVHSGNVANYALVPIAPTIKKSGSDADYGGQLFFELCANSELDTGIRAENYKDVFRIMEVGGKARGAFLDITKCATGATTELLHTGNSTGIKFTEDNTTAPASDMLWAHL